MSTPIHGANGTATSSRVSSAVVVNQKERINGWTCPWHPLQFIAWFFIIFFAISYFGVHVFYLPVEWRAAGFIIPGGLLLIHIIYHLLALTIDPADRNIHGGSRRGKAIFDRTQHQHVIEDFHCYICQADVGAKTKHCSVCNKCVSDFDHHCKWLNNCVGGRNYRLFIGCISSAFALAVMVFTITLYIIIVYCVRKEDLSCLTDSKSFEILKQVVSGTAFIVFTAIVGALLLITIALLGHLLGFHIYLMCHKMSTYDFIVNSRERRTHNNDVEAGHNISPPSRKLFKNKVSPEADRERESSHQERIELTDNARSEGSEETIPNEPTVKIISEVSSKAAAKQSRPSFEQETLQSRPQEVDLPSTRSPAVANYSPRGITEPLSSEESLKEIVCTTPRVAIQGPFDFSQASTSAYSQDTRNQYGGETSSPRPGTSREKSDDDGEELVPSPRGKKPKKGGKSKRQIEIDGKKDVLFESNGQTNAENFATMKKSKKYATGHLPPLKTPNRGRPLPVLEPENP